MKELQNSDSLGLRGVAIIAAAIGAVAVGACAIGALTIRRLAIRRVVVGSVEFKSLEIQDLTVRRLRAAEVIVSDSLELPGGNSAGPDLGGSMASMPARDLRAY